MCTPTNFCIKNRMALVPHRSESTFMVYGDPPKWAKSVVFEFFRKRGIILESEVETKLTLSNSMARKPPVQFPFRSEAIFMVYGDTSTVIVTVFARKKDTIVAALLMHNQVNLID